MWQELTWTIFRNISEQWDNVRQFGFSIKKEKKNRIRAHKSSCFWGDYFLVREKNAVSSLFSECQGSDVIETLLVPLSYNFKLNNSHQKVVKGYSRLLTNKYRNNIFFCFLSLRIIWPASVPDMIPGKILSCNMNGIT